MLTAVIRRDSAQNVNILGFSNLFTPTKCLRAARLSRGFAAVLPPGQLGCLCAEVIEHPLWFRPGLWAIRAANGDVECRGLLQSCIVREQMRTYHLGLYQRQPGGLPLHDHVRSISFGADNREEAVEEARVTETPNHLADCAIVFDDRGEVIALWHLREIP